MSDEGDEGDDDGVPTLERLGAVVTKRNTEVWRAFVVAQASAQKSARRRDITTQRILLTSTRRR